MIGKLDPGSRRCRGLARQSRRNARHDRQGCDPGPKTLSKGFHFRRKFPALLLTRIAIPVSCRSVMGDKGETAKWVREFGQIAATEKSMAIGVE
jgi:hypothetical protein